MIIWEADVTENLFLNKSIGEIHDEYRKGNIDPVDVANECIKQYEELEDKFQAWVCFDKEILLKQAKQTRLRIKNNEPLRLLEGIPVGIKDIFNTKDFPTQMGSPIWKDFTPGNDARVVYNIKHRGGLIPGKTVTAEFAVHTLNETLNPFDITKTPGTSSSGSAVAIALGMLPVSIGTQTAASITRPASFCGIYGCKPSFGFIPRTGMLKTTDSLDTIGFFASRLVDLERLFESLRVHGPNYPICNNAIKDIKRQNKAINQPWKVALVKTHTWEHAPQYAKDAFINWGKKLEASKNIEVSEVDLPDKMKRTHEIHSLIYDKTLSYYFKNEYERAELVSKTMNEIIKRGTTISVNQYLNAVKEQDELCHIMDDFMVKFDIIVSLCTAGEAPLRDVSEKPDSGLMWTMTHLPVISAPVFISPSGMPLGLQLASRKYNDLLLFKFSDLIHSLGLLPDGNNPVFDIRKHPGIRHNNSD